MEWIKLARNAGRLRAIASAAKETNDRASSALLRACRAKQANILPEMDLCNRSQDQANEATATADKAHYAACAAYRDANRTTRRIVFV